MSEQDDIRQTLTHYVRYADERNAVGWAALFTEDATFSPRGGQSHVGRTAIHDWFVALFSARPPGNRSMHLCGNHDIVVTGDTAEAISDVVVYECDNERPWALHQINRYFDRLVRHGPRWLIAERRIEGR